MRKLLLVLLCGCGDAPSPPLPDCSRHLSCGTCAGDDQCRWCPSSSTCRGLSSGYCSAEWDLLDSQCGGGSSSSSSGSGGGGAACSSSADCGCGSTCDLDGRCLSGGSVDDRWCCSDADCPSGYLCWGCACLRRDTCATSEDCSLGQYCSVGGYCHCRDAGECGYNEICDNGVCRAPNTACRSGG